MPYRDPDIQREYQRRWKAERRAAWFAGKTCEFCGATEALELHHADPAEKVSHKIWSWSDERREAELAKCVVLCRPCHENEHWSRLRQERLDSLAGAHAWLAEYDRRRRDRLVRRRAKRLRTEEASK